MKNWLDAAGVLLLAVAITAVLAFAVWRADTPRVGERLPCKCQCGCFKCGEGGTCQP